jgi:alpha-2-macroglobulin
MSLASRWAIPLYIMLLALGGCSRDPHPARDAPDAHNASGDTHSSDLGQWDTHLDQVPRGWISADATLRLRFTHPVVDASSTNRPLSGIVKTFPPQPVTAVFTAPDTLEVRHSEPFKSGSKLQLILSPDKLLNLAQGLPDLELPLQVLEQGLALREAGFSIDPSNPNILRLEGELLSSDAANPAAVEKTLSAALDGQPLKITWKHSNPRAHRFTVQGVTRDTRERELRISWNGTPIGAASRGERNIAVPAQANFLLTSARAVQSPDPHIEARFSMALDATQNLQGMARLDGRDTRTQVDGNILRVYNDTAPTGSMRLALDAGIRSVRGNRLAVNVERDVIFAPETPAVRFAESGHILPASAHISIPFEAVAVTAVRLRAFEIYAGNIGQFLQENGLDFSAERAPGDYAHRDVGRYLWQKTITLPNVSLEKWQRFDLDVSELIQSRKGSLLRLELEILPQFSAYPCDSAPEARDDSVTQLRSYDGFYREASVPAHLSRYFQQAGYYEWNRRNDPCHASYYSNYNDKVAAAQIFFASSIGLLAKQGDDEQMHVLVTDLHSANPLPDAVVSIFNFQRQRIGGGRTDRDGLLSTTLEGIPFHVMAEHQGDSAYLKVARNAPLPNSQFSTGGKRTEHGIKGFFYAERDIWRPGDTMHLTFVLMDRDKRLPADYPVTLDLFDPRGARTQSVTNTAPVGGFYAFTLGTDENAATGNWRAIVRIGEQYFDQLLKVENIAPNRIKIDLELPGDKLLAEALPARVALKARWLNGSEAAALRSDVAVRLSAGTTRIEGLDGYRFDDMARSFTQEPATVFNGQLDANGNAGFDLSLTLDAPPPGMLDAVFTQRVFEPGGQFSTQYRSVPFYPFSSWIGIHAPEGQSAYAGALDERRDHVFELASVTPDGKPITNRRLQLTLHAIEWRWWWENREENFARYISDDVRRPVESATLATDAGGRANWTLIAGRHASGRHLLRVCDLDAVATAQHCSSQEIYLGWGWGEQHGRDAATRIAISSDRERYSVGDSARIQLPEGGPRRVFVSIENGSRVLSRYWQTLARNVNHLELPLDASMSPNIYVHVTQLQPHQARDNDVPIRSYGIVPLVIDDPDTRMLPLIEAPQRVRPESSLEIAVREERGRAMSYTLALVDEGLLGITDYRTPDPHDAFYSREALGVLTWDLFDLVVGAYGADLSRLLAVGGSDALLKRDSNRERRFPPIVRFLGPFTLAAGARATHHVELPSYMGAVRLMVVAGDGRAWGKAEREVSVTQPLTVFATLPRVLGPGEELDVPVTVFASEPPFGEVRVTASGDELIRAISAHGNVRFSKAGEATTRLRMAVNAGLGNARFEVRATLVAADAAAGAVGVPETPGSVEDMKGVPEQQLGVPEQSPEQEVGVPERGRTEQEVGVPERRERGRTEQEVGVPERGRTASATTAQAREIVDVPVRTPNLPTSDSERRLLAPGESWTPSLAPHGMIGTRSTTLSVSSAPELGLSSRLDYLFDYPHGCLEQTVSSAFPQLYLGDLVELDDEQSLASERHVAAAIARLSGFQASNGAFAFWPHASGDSAWANSYAGHFLIEARSRGHEVPAALLDDWLVHQQGEARSFDDASAPLQTEQAYRLYTLALAARPDAGAMNRLREALRVSKAKHVVLARRMLALAYEQSGMRDAALEQLALADADMPAPPHSSLHFGSTLRDNAVLLLLRQRLGQREAAWDMGQEIARELASGQWLGTHETAWALLALAQAFGAQAGSETRFAIRENDEKWQSIAIRRSIYSQVIETYDPGKLVIRNDAGHPLHVSLTHRGTPTAGAEQPRSNGLEMDIRFSALDGTPLQVHSLPQGQDFVAEVTVRNTLARSLDNVALTQVLPSGWQIRNTRLEGAGPDAAIEYQDVRDDRLHSYFALAAAGSIAWPEWWREAASRPVADNVTVRVLLNASFAGRFYLPLWRVEPMYDAGIGASSAGQWVEVLAP